MKMVLLFHKEARVEKHLLKIVSVSLGRGMGFSEGHMTNKLAALALARFLAVRKFCLVHTPCFIKKLGYENIWQRVYLCH